MGPGTRVLDVGCGTGTVSAAAVARGASVHAADADPGMAAATRRAVPGVTPHIAQLPELPYPDDTFDAAVGNFVLNHAGRPLAVLAELRRITRPGGRVAVTIWRSPGAPGQTLRGSARSARSSPAEARRGWRRRGVRMTACAPNSARGKPCWCCRTLRCWHAGGRSERSKIQRWRFISSYR
ncbi:class I SAM-dependent methyltransferase [Streptomyces rubiginosohelvolus]|uniref:class I SAM-dependent methyltransferase n=1 Tax=Streptomyces rubiginosohelvolus TaxID=67362 RepID=UPI0037A2948C